MRGRIAALSCLLLFLITASTYWWRSTDSDGHRQSLSDLLAPLSSGYYSSSPSSASNSPFAIKQKVAVIIETRPVPTLIPLILHFASVLGPEWPILFFTRPSVVRTLAALGHGSAPFARMVQSGQIQIIELPSEPDLGKYLGLSRFLASEWFWKQMGSAEYMLNFQSDSVLCANSGRRVEDFFEYDFVGAYHPWVDGAFNGGLSLRNVEMARRVIGMYNISDDVGAGTDDGLYEDVWFCNKMKDMGARFPSPERASEFAIDMTWSERPLGIHGLNRPNREQQQEKKKEIYAWCPEAALADSSTEVVELNEDEKKSLKIMQDKKTKGGTRLPFG